MRSLAYAAGSTLTLSLQGDHFLPTVLLPETDAPQVERGAGPL